MLKRLFLWLTLCSLFHAASPFALQTKTMQDNQTAFFKISAKELTRIFVEDDRIRSARGLEGHYQLTKDEAQGAIFIKSIHPNPFNLFLTTETGHNYTLRLTPIDIHAEVIQLQPLTPLKVKAAQWEKDSPYVDAIIQLISSMVNGTPAPEGYAVIHVDSEKSKKRPSGITMQLKTLYQGNGLQGEIWLIKNTYCRSIKIKKREFYQSNVRAMALQDESLKNCDSTYLYRVVGR